MSDKINSNLGHRSRLREKFLKSGLDGFLDYEVVEILLTLGTPRKDCKQSAKDAMVRFKNLASVLDASAEDLQQIKGIGPSNIFGIKLFHAISERYSKENIDSKILLYSPKKIFEFLKEKIGKESKEHFVILYFDTKNNLIFDEISIGTLNASLVHPREVFSKAISCHASHIVIAHNHPSGDVFPSIDDRGTTNRLKETGKIIGISIIDHIIVSNKKYYSFKENNLI